MAGRVDRVRKGRGGRGAARERDEGDMRVFAFRGLLALEWVVRERGALRYFYCTERATEKTLRGMISPLPP